ncbi:hypothetical protein VPH35_066044 [Triticum aestivum]
MACQGLHRPLQSRLPPTFARSGKYGSPPTRSGQSGPFPSKDPADLPASRRLLPPLYHTGASFPCFCVRAREDDDKRQVLLLQLTAARGPAPRLGQLPSEPASSLGPRPMVPMIPEQVTQPSSSGSSMKILIIVLFRFLLISSGA